MLSGAKHPRAKRNRCLMHAGTSRSGDEAVYDMRFARNDAYFVVCEKHSVC